MVIVFTNKDNSAGCIYIVRDPRDIVVSASKYYNTTHEQMVKEATKKGIMPPINKPISTFVSVSHYNSWIKNSKNILLVKNQT